MRRRGREEGREGREEREGGGRDKCVTICGHEGWIGGGGSEGEAGSGGGGGKREGGREGGREKDRDGGRSLRVCICVCARARVHTRVTAYFVRVVRFTPAAATRAATRAAP